MGLIAEDIIQGVIERADIVEIVGEYVPLKKAGRNFKGLSPFNNEKTPSFIVSPDKQIFHCFSSGVGGNVVSFVMKMERLNFPEAIRFLAKKVNVVIPEAASPDPGADESRRIYDVNRMAAEFYHDRLVTGKDSGAAAARDYVKGRGFDLETVRTFQLGHAPDDWEALISHLRSKNISLALVEKAGLIIARENKQGFYDRFRNRVMFPIIDAQGRCRAFGARALETGDTAKYLNSPETRVYVKGRHLYGFHLAKNAVAREDFAVIVEGYVDCIMPFQAGIRNIVAALGTALTVEQIRLLRRYTKSICLLFDNDRAGEAAMLRSFDLLIEEDMEVKVASLAPGEDPDSFIRKFGPEEFRKCLLDARSLFDFKLDRLMQEHDARSVDGRSRIASAMLATVQKFNSAVAKAGYLRQLAYRLNVPESALFEDLKKVDAALKGGKESVPGPSSGVPARPFASGQLRAVETNILKLILEEEKFVGHLRAEAAVSDFQDQSIRQVISTIYDLFDKGRKITYNSLLGALPEEAAKHLVTGLITEESIIVENKDKMYSDCIQRIKQDRLRQQRQMLLHQIREAEGRHDEPTLEMLKAQFNELIKQAV